MNRALNVLEFFSGIGACSKALENLGISFNLLDSVEINKFAVNSFNAVHGTTFEPQDITKWDKDLTDRVDLLMHGSPCQDFSVAGKNNGGDEGSGTRSSLMYETLRIVDKLKPRVVIWENVKNLLSKTHRHNFDNYIERMDALGYVSFYKVLNASDYGVPQHRERVFTVSFLRTELEGEQFEFPVSEPLTLKLSDLLYTSSEVPERYFLSNEKHQTLVIENTKVTDRTKPSLVGGIGSRNYGRQYRMGNRVYSSDSVAMALPAQPLGNAGGYSYLYTVENAVSGKDSVSERFYRQAFETAEEGKAKAGDIINAFNRTVNKTGVIPTLTTRPEGFKTAILPVVYDSEGKALRIRKLMPVECWLLMGFDEDSYRRAEKVSSHCQLYKQAGNSIVVTVLEKLIEKIIETGVFEK